MTFDKFVYLQNIQIMRNSPPHLHAHTHLSDDGAPSNDDGDDIAITIELVDGREAVEAQDPIEEPVGD